uniref:Uncharacterized protein n=1 Tax=Klebsiella pneumoniae TaxID=573 RepID=A0A2P1BPI7_KLEPN|nr:hypothetical protein [Klebsiella pneumoniae]
MSASTPRNCFHSFEAHWADFARVFVGPAPTPMVRRVQSYTCCRSCRPKSSVHAVLHTGQIEEHLVNRILFHPGASSSVQLITRADMDA